jgi:hypothetical protein
MMIVIPVQFAADSAHSETIHLGEKYKALHIKISSIFVNKNCLETALNQLTSN